MNTARNREIMAKWEAMQTKTFTKWVNMHLAKKGKSIENVTTDFKNGVALIQLLEIIGEVTFPRYNKTPRMRLQMVENAAAALRFIKDRNVQLTNIGPEDIVDGNPKLALGLIWSIILRFAISDLSEEGLAGKQGLLLWCQKKTHGYDHVSVKDFQDSFKDGRAFCALIHRHRPDLLNYADCTDDARTNLNMAFDAAESGLGIPKLLDVDDMVTLPKPDERSVMTYCAALYKVFSQYDQLENQGRRLGRFLDVMKAATDMINDYERRAAALRALAEEKIAAFANAVIAQDYVALRGQMANLKEYRRGDKSKISSEIGDLSVLLSSIQIKLKSLNRAAYVPPEGLGIRELEELVEQLTQEERNHRAAVSAALRACLDALRHAFADPANALYEALAATKDFLGQTSDASIEEQKAECEAKKEEVAGYAAQLPALKEAEDACEAANIEENEYTDQTYEDLEVFLNQLLRQLDKKIAFLDAQINEDAHGIPADKMMEYQESFNHFDEDGSQTLERLEFFACLGSLGLVDVDFTGSNAEAEAIFQRVSEGKGFVTFDQYVQYVSALLEDSFDPAALLEMLTAIADGKEFVTEADMARAGLDQEQIEFVKETLPVHPDCADGYDFSQWTQ